MLDYSKFILEKKKGKKKKKKRLLSGVAVTYNGRILLVNSKKHKFKKSRWSIPKGKRDGDASIEAALKELYEESSIKLKRSDLNGPYIINYDNKEMDIYLASITKDDLDFPLYNNMILRSYIRNNEIVEAGFFTKEDAFNLLDKNQRKVLDLLDYELVNENLGSKVKFWLNKVKNFAKREGGETRVALSIINSYISKKLRNQNAELTDEEVQFLKSHSKDLARILGVAATQAIPAPPASITPLLIFLQRKYGIQIFPSAKALKLPNKSSQNKVKLVDVFNKLPNRSHKIWKHITKDEFYKKSFTYDYNTIYDLIDLEYNDSTIKEFYSNLNDSDISKLDKVKSKINSENEYVITHNKELLSDPFKLLALISMGIEKVPVINLE